MRISLAKGGAVNRDGKPTGGEWWRKFNGKLDRGVKQGDWVGTLRNGVGFTSKTKRGLREWFDKEGT